MAGLVNVGMTAALFSRSPVAVVLFVVFTVIGTILAIGAMIVAPQARSSQPSATGSRHRTWSWPPSHSS